MPKNYVDEVSSATERALQELLEAANEWYEYNRKIDSTPRTNTMNAGLVVAQMVRDGLPITDDRLKTPNKSQVKNLTGARVKNILRQHNETRRFTSEGGRTSRGTLPKAEDLVERWNSVDVANTDLVYISHELEDFFVQKVQEDYFNKQRISVIVDPAKPVSVTVREIIEAASDRPDKPAGSVLQHLVGAKLQLRFPEIEIGLDHSNAADQQTGRQGDFQVKTTAFHVTMAPSEKVIERCQENLRNGYRPVLIVPARRVAGARDNADMAGIGDKVSVIDAETYIGTNIEEISQYDGDEIRSGLAALVRTYNYRIRSSESDASLQIEEPGWMEKFAS
ncbi:DUF4928 family protein [Corynebacterium tuberculostearicum]|uniref:DUF4928 family protein n=1 Tax=Corynebacterium tuberculostearicum TaxID=38304 RepID=UPI002653BC43|nr:DUF4928 family protein [Corynebacterium tuberculostearicum]MDN8596385.1 DUF4928 family protein [Corynebacterium tuberculostearicum]